MTAAVRNDESPIARVVGERVALKRIDLVANHARDHGWVPRRLRGAHVAAGERESGARRADDRDRLTPPDVRHAAEPATGGHTHASITIK